MKTVNHDVVKVQLAQIVEQAIKTLGQEEQVPDIYRTLGFPPDATMGHQTAALFVLESESMDRFRELRAQRFPQQPETIRGFQLVIAIAFFELGTVEIGPAVDDSSRQVRQVQQLDFNLIQPLRLVLRFHIHNTQLVAAKFPLVIGIENGDLGNRRRQLPTQHGVEKMDQQPPVVLRPQQGFEHAVHFGINSVFHSICRPRSCR